MHCSHRGTQCTSIRSIERLVEAGVEHSVGDWADDVIDESINGSSRPRSSPSLLLSMESRAPVRPVAHATRLHRAFCGKGGRCVRRLDETMVRAVLPQSAESLERAAPRSRHRTAGPRMRYDGACCAGRYGTSGELTPPPSFSSAVSLMDTFALSRRAPVMASSLRLRASVDSRARIRAFSLAKAGTCAG